MRSSHSLSWAKGIAVAALLALALLPCGAAEVQTAVSQTTADRVTLHYVIPTPTLATVDIDGRAYVQVTLDREPLLSEAGAPALPRICRSIILPDAGTPVLNVLSATYNELTEIDVAPSKGLLLRTVDPDSVPYAFGPEYATDAFYPGAVAELDTPYILRDYRGVVVALNPFQYNPVKRTLRIYRELVVEVVTRGNGGVNALDRTQRSGLIDRGFRTIYAHHFVNHAQAHLRYNPLDEQGDLLIICHDAWLANVQPLVTHKIARGLNTTLVGVSTIGNNATAIKNYIQGVYNSSDLAYVLLVGDAAQIATPYASGGSADPTYSKLAGGDNYPDIIVGRFSAETATQVDTQVLRTITYENLPAPLQDWFWKGVGIASAQGAGQGDEGQADYVHMDEIRQWLLACGYTLVDQIYDTNGGTAAMVSNALNAGRGIVNYCGHGSTTSWSTTGFSNTNVAALVNDNMLPFIVSVACVNGQFDGYTCFAEAWLRASHNGVPTGAIGTYMSSINQSWAPPMEAQDEFNLLLCAETYVSYGALCYAGSCSMMDDYGSGGVDMFNTWHIFGDPSVRIALTCIDQGSATLDAPRYGCEDTVLIAVTDCGLNLDDLNIDTATVTIASDTEPAGETVVVTELGPALGQFAGSIVLSATNASGVLQVSAGDT
ncbi:MAG TPA: C25 family cysteine peptidase, partial [Phycisphaerae bacterium]|nr:C25 family cysteine peptidase [Phycisphaerae bacterium]